MYLRIINKSWIKAQFQLKPKDIWIGAFWRKNYEIPSPYYTLHIYICFIPIMPLHITLLLKQSANKVTKQKDDLYQAMNDMRIE